MLANHDVVWHRCEGCDRDWPFPKGFDPYEQREWRCHVCVQADWARLERQQKPDPQPEQFNK